MTDLLQDTRPMAAVDHPIRLAAHRKPDPLRAALLAMNEAYHQVWPLIAAGAVAAVVLVPSALLLLAAYIQEHGVIAAMQAGADTVEALVIALLGWWLAAFLCDRIDAKARAARNRRNASGPSTSSSDQHRKAARP